MRGESGVKRTNGKDEVAGSGCSLPYLYPTPPNLAMAWGTCITATCRVEPAPDDCYSLPPPPTTCCSPFPTYLYPAERCEGVMDTRRDVPCSPSSVALLTPPPTLNLPQSPTHLHPAERCEGVVDTWRDVPCSPAVLVDAVQVKRSLKAWGSVGVGEMF